MVSISLTMKKTMSMNPTDSEYEEEELRARKRKSKRRRLTSDIVKEKKRTRTERIGYLEAQMRLKNEEMKKLMTQQKVVLNVIEAQRKERQELKKEVFWLKKDMSRVRAAWNNT